MTASAFAKDSLADTSRIPLSASANGDTYGSTASTFIPSASAREAVILHKNFTLIAKGISGIAVKTAYYDSIPEAAVFLAEEHRIPLFLFHDVYMEDIIVSVNRLHEWSERSEYYEEQIPDFLNPHHSANARHIFITRYHTGFLFLFHYDTICTPSKAQAFMLQVLEDLSLPDASPVYALCEILHPAKDLEMLLLKCFYTDVSRILICPSPVDHFSGRLTAAYAYIT